MINGPLETLKRARKLRGEMSFPEVLLWPELRKRPGGFMGTAPEDMELMAECRRFCEAAWGIA